MAKYERTVKQSHLDTIYYEIDMLKYTGERLINAEYHDLPDFNLLIEGFLLHYRNLLEFFSGNKHYGESPNDPNSTSSLSVRNPTVWGKRKLTIEERRDIVEAAAAIFYPDWTDISQYLQHCTEKRYKSSRDWKIPDMLAQIGAIIGVFETGFPRNKVKIVVGPPNNSTATFIDGSTSTYTARLSPIVKKKNPSAKP